MRCKRKFCSSSTSSCVNPIMFFKVYIPDRSYQQLQLPSAFVKRLNYVFPPKSIRLCFGKSTWSVDVEEIGNTLVFQNGWSDFVHGSSLEPGDFLVFTYLGAARLSVQIYGPTGCEKNNVYALRKCKIEREDDILVPCDQHKQMCLHRDEMNKVVTYEQHDQYEPTNQIGEVMNTCGDNEQLNDRYELTNHDGEGVNKLAEDEQLHDQYEQTNLHEGEMNKSADEEQSSFEDSDYHHESEGVSDENRKKKYRKKKSNVDKKRPRVRNKPPKHKIWNGDGKKNRVPNVSYTSAYPHFKMGLLPVYVSRASLNVPMPFAQKYMKPGKIRTTLQAFDKSWPVTLTTYTNGCCKISSGWLAFVRDNCIREGDICVFELIDLNVFTFKVSIFPMCP